jgi:hypothetical protein
MGWDARLVVPWKVDGQGAPCGPISAGSLCFNDANAFRRISVGQLRTIAGNRISGVSYKQLVACHLFLPRQLLLD